MTANADGCAAGAGAVPGRGTASLTDPPSGGAV
jgi:hypothetical protein